MDGWMKKLHGWERCQFTTCKCDKTLFLKIIWMQYLIQSIYLSHELPSSNVFLGYLFCFISISWGCLTSSTFLFFFFVKKKKKIKIFSFFPPPPPPIKDDKNTEPQNHNNFFVLEFVRKLHGMAATNKAANRVRLPGVNCWSFLRNSVMTVKVMVKPGVQLYKIPNKVKLVPCCCIGRGSKGLATWRG